MRPFLKLSRIYQTHSTLILRKLQPSNSSNPRFCKKIFDLVAAAQRLLTLEELCEATSVKPGETAWDASKVVNNMLKSLLDSCGSLVAVDDCSPHAS